MSELAIESQGLSKAYRRGEYALRGLDLRVQARQVYGFLGPNGAGKTTTIRLLLDLIRPTEGTIRIFGQPVYRNPAALRRVGALVEGASFYPYLSAWDNLLVLGRTLGSFDPKRAAQLLDSLGLSAQQHGKVGQFSTGMQQRLGIVAALLHDPALVILDEPTNGLDPQGIRALRSFVRHLVEAEGRTVFLCSHLLNEVQQVCDRVAVIHQGKLLVEGTVEDLLASQPSTRVQIEVDAPDRALALLQETARASLTPDHHILLQTEHQQIPALVRQLVAAGIEIYAVQPQQSSLEDFFLTITQEP